MTKLNHQTILYRKTLGCLVGGLIGDAMGTPSEGMDFQDIEKKFGWIDDFSSDGTDDTVMKSLLADALIRTGGYAGADEWAEVWRRKIRRIWPKSWPIPPSQNTPTRKSTGWLFPKYSLIERFILNHPGGEYE